MRIHSLNNLLIYFFNNNAFITLQILFNKLPLYQTVEYCLKNIIQLTPADAYEVLRATNLNHLIKFVINWLIRETISMLC